MTPSSPVSSEIPETAEKDQLAVALQSQDYLRRIHWWVRLFGVAWLSAIGLTALVFVTLTALTALQANRDADLVRSRFDSVTTTTGPATGCSAFDPATHLWKDVPCN